MGRCYYSIDEKDVSTVGATLSDAGITFKFTFDPMEYVCDELAEAYIENNVEPELRPIFREQKDNLSQWLLEEVDDIIDGNLVIEIAREFELEDEDGYFEEYKDCGGC